MTVNLVKLTVKCLENPSTFKPTNEQENQINYKIFTTQFDEVVSAQELCDFEELKRLRTQLDRQLGPTGCCI